MRVDRDVPTMVGTWNQAVHNVLGGTVSYAQPKASTTYTSANLGMASS